MREGRPLFRGRLQFLLRRPLTWAVIVICLAMLCYVKVQERCICTWCGRAELRTVRGIGLPFSRKVVCSVRHKALRRDDGFLVGVLDPDAMCSHRWITYHERFSWLLSWVLGRQEGHAPIYPMFSSLPDSDRFKVHLAAQPDTLEEIRRLLEARSFLSLAKVLADEHGKWCDVQEEGGAHAVPKEGAIGGPRVGGTRSR